MLNRVFVRRTFRECRVYSRTRLFRDPYEAVGTESVQYTVSVAPFVSRPLSSARRVTLTRATELF